MDKSTRTRSGRGQLTAVPPSRRLLRRKSGSSPAAITTPERSSSRFNSSERFNNINSRRSRSTSKTRTHHSNEDNINPTLVTVTAKSQEKSTRDVFAYKFLRRGVSPDNSIGASRRATSSSMKSPSAWALSPGRGTLGSPIIGPGSPAKVKGGGGGVGGGVSKVFKYFKQRKVSSMQEEENHRFRILHNRLLQWRFVNARAEAAMATVKKVAEIQLFSVWLRILVLKNILMKERIELLKVKHTMKLHQIISPQLSLLNEWAKLERRNQESVSRLERKLSALSTKLPLIHGLKADAESVYEALNTAIKVMKSIQPLIPKYQKQVERILYQVTELTTTSKQEEEYLQELLAIVPMISALLENEKSIRVHLIQTKMESNNRHHPCSVG